MARRAHEVPLPWIRVDRALGIPAERQIAAALRQAIRQGLLPHGFHLPSIRQLALEAEVSRRVVANAYERLEHEGYVSSNRGGATFVSADAVPQNRTSVLAASRRALAMPPRPRGALAPGSVALDEFPWRRWQASPRIDLDLREVIATRICPTRGIVASAEEIVITAGREAAIACAAQLLTEAGDSVLVETPGDPRTRAIYENHGLSWRADRVDAEGLVFDATAEPPRLVHVTPSRHYPMGAAMTLGRQFLLLQYAKAVQAAILEEDRDGDDRALKASDRDGRVVYLGSFEKTLFPDVGVAFLVMPAELAALATQLATPPSATVQSILASFITSGELGRHRKRMRAIHEERREAFTSALRSHVGDVYPGSALDLVLWLDPSCDDESVAAVTGAMALRSCATTPEELPPALIMGYGSVTPCNALVAAENIAVAVHNAAKRRLRA